MDKIKDFLSNINDRTKKLVIAGVIGVLVITGAVIAALSMRQKPYEVMFTGVGSEEAKQIIGKLQEDQIDYQYKDGDIMVPTEKMDTTKAMLVSDKY